ncbi:spherulin-1A [Xylariaceae sp. FL0255]|nr:spherulin-1A [Xylariaceae sp. FL0255]
MLVPQLPSWSTLGLGLGLLLLCLPTLAIAQNSDSLQSIDISLEEAPTQLDKDAILNTNSSWVFDFTAQDTYGFNPGGITLAEAKTFPATVGNGLTMSLVTLGPCAMQPPHYHPRASNYIVSVDGEVQTYMITENAAPLVSNTLTPGKMTLFPRGALHAMQNTASAEDNSSLTSAPGCSNVTLVSALDDTDSGIHTIAMGLFNLPQDIVFAAMGLGQNVNFESLKDGIPQLGAGIILGSDICRQQCGMEAS